MNRTGHLLSRIDAAPALAELSRREVNYRPDEVRPGPWVFDTWTSSLPGERPGAPEPGGSWESACALVEAYEFCDPAVLRAVYAPAAPLLGRDMLLEARFYGLRFYLGVRVTEVIDEKPGDAARRMWGFAYETLDGHLERGRISYEVIKDDDTGQVSFRLQAYSQRASTLGLITTLGWQLFGRRTQRRFYRRSGERLAAATAARRGRPDVVPARRGAGGLVLAPSDAGHSAAERFAIRWRHPS